MKKGLLSWRVWRNKRFNRVNRLKATVGALPKLPWSPRPRAVWRQAKEGVIIYPQGGEDLGLNMLKFSRSPLWMLLHWSDLPNNFWWLSRPPLHVFIFQANLSGPPSESFQSFQWSVFSQFRLIPLFVLLKIKWSPPKILRPPPQAIDNDRSLNQHLASGNNRISSNNSRPRLIAYLE